MKNAVIVKACLAALAALFVFSGAMAQTVPSYRTMTKKQQKARVQELRTMDVSMDALLDLTDDEVKALKKEYQYFRAKYMKKANTLLWVGIGGTVAGIATGIVGIGMKKPPVWIGGIALAGGGIYSIVQSSIYSGIATDLTNKGGQIIVTDGYALSFGVSAHSNAIDNSVYFGPSVKFNF